MIKMTDSVASVLIIDRDPKIFDTMVRCTYNCSVHFDYASTLAEGIKKSRSDMYQVILMRASLPDGDACYVVEDLQQGEGIPAEIIVFTTVGNIEQAEIALKGGVWEYLIDANPEKVLPELVGRALHYRQSKSEECAGIRVTFTTDYKILASSAGAVSFKSA